MTYSINHRPVKIYKYDNAEKSITLDRASISRFQRSSKKDLSHELMVNSRTLLLQAWLEKSKNIIVKIDERIGIYTARKRKLIEAIKDEQLEEQILQKSYRRALQSFERAEAGKLNTQKRIEALGADIARSIGLSKAIVANEKEIRNKIREDQNFLENVKSLDMPIGSMFEKSAETIDRLKTELISANDTVDEYMKNSMNPAFVFFSLFFEPEKEIDGTCAIQYRRTEVERLAKTLAEAEYHKRISRARECAQRSIRKAPKIILDKHKSYEKDIKNIKKKMRFMQRAGFVPDFQDIDLDSMIKTTAENIRTFNRLNMLLFQCESTFKTMLDNSVEVVESFYAKEKILARLNDFDYDLSLDKKKEEVCGRIENLIRCRNSIERAQKQVRWEIEDRQQLWIEKNKNELDHARRKELADEKYYDRLEQKKKFVYKYKEKTVKFDEMIKTIPEDEKITRFMLEAEELFTKYLPRHYTLKNEYLREMKKFARAYIEYGRIDQTVIDERFRGEKYRDEEDFSSSGSTNIYRVGFSGRGKYRFLIDIDEPEAPRIIYIGHADECHRKIKQYLYDNVGFCNGDSSLFEALKD